MQSIYGHYLIFECKFTTFLGGKQIKMTFFYIFFNFYLAISKKSSNFAGRLGCYAITYRQIERNYDFLEYVYEGKTFKFYPDFLVNGSLKEIKGFYTPKNKEKKEQCKTVEFIDKNKIKPYLSYVIDKYGKDFTYLYDNKNKHNESCDDSLCYSLF